MKNTDDMPLSFWLSILLIFGGLIGSFYYLNKESKINNHQTFYIDRDKKFLNIQPVYGNYYILTRLRETNEVSKNTYFFESNDHKTCKISVIEY